MKANALIRVACVVLASACAMSSPARAASSSSANFVTPRDVAASGGTSAASANFSTGSTAGQAAIGNASSANFRMSAGFWPAGSVVFALLAQANVAVVTPITSNAITIAGLPGPAAISIASGAYSINGGPYTSVSGIVNNGDVVTVRLTSSASYNATATATLTIDSVPGDFSVTTAAAATSTPTITGTGGGSGGGTSTGTATPGPGQPASCGFDPSSQFIPLEGAPQSPPAGSAPKGVTFPFGLFDFVLTGCAPGGSVTITVTYPQVIPPGTQYWKYGATAANTSPHWYTIPATFNGNTATFTLVDGGLGDDDMTPNGMIMDQGGPGFGSTAIPTLSEWSLLALAILMGLFGLAGLRRKT